MDPTRRSHTCMHDTRLFTQPYTTITRRLVGGLFSACRAVQNSLAHTTHDDIHTESAFRQKTKKEKESNARSKTQILSYNEIGIHIILYIILLMHSFYLCCARSLPNYAAVLFACCYLHDTTRSRDETICIQAF
jgi:hypothetical protein